ncbi:hypothetical protein RDI58_007746 [Solanum bulbocastanum]|uniref:Uncharacterized protein n=1 Tax=Solanum bulbocastanum TaxID=147425 RepID=A0AAN8YMG7_SOLBU
MGFPIVLPHAESDEAADCYFLLHLYFLLKVYSGIGEATTRLFAQYRSSSSTSKMNRAKPWRHPSLHKFAAMCNETNTGIVGSSGEKVLDLDLSEFDWVMNGKCSRAWLCKARSTSHGGEAC